MINSKQDGMLVDKRILAGGIAIIIAGMIVAVSSAVPPAGQPGMTDDEIIELLIAEDENKAYQMLSGILVGIGFLLALISFGARRRKSKGGDSIKKEVQEPPE